MIYNVLDQSDMKPAIKQFTRKKGGEKLIITIQMVDPLAIYWACKVSCPAGINVYKSTIN